MIAEKMEELSIGAKTDLLEQNQDADAVYFLKQGMVKILVNGEMVAQVDTVQCFGEMSCLLPDTPASATVQTAEKSHIVKIAKNDFQQVVNKIPKIWKTLFLQMNSRFRSVNMRLSEVLEHTPQGLVKVDKNSVITSEYSIECTRYFGKENLSGINFPKLIMPNNEEGQLTWQETFPMLYDEETLPFDDIAALLNQDTKYSHPEGGTKEFVFSYYPCRGIGGEITAVDIGIEDVTAARELERQNEKMQREQQIMGKIYENPESFINLRQFLTDTLTNVLSLIRSFTKTPIADLSEEIIVSMRMLHSLKGFSGIFSLSVIQESSHELESLVKKIQKQGRAEASDLEAMAQWLNRLKEDYQYTTVLFNNIGDSLKKRLLGTVLSANEFEQLRSSIRSKDLASIEKLLESIEKMDARRLVSTWEEEGKKLLDELGKKAEIVLQGEGGFITRRAFRLLEGALVHLLRNAIDHGIETPEERKQAGKSETAAVTIHIEQQEEGLVFKVSDDGRGIDLEKLAEKAKENLQVDQNKVQAILEKGEAWKVLFLPGFSTAAEVTKISGRGVGLDAIWEAVTNLGGKISMDTEAGKGTTFQVTLPVQ